MNGMQIPPTSSAPPNLDEQKRDQARSDALKPAPRVPASVPKQQVPRKDMSGSEQSNTAEVHPVSKTKKDSQVSPAPQMNQTQKPSVLPHPMTPMPMSFHQPQVAMQFGGPNPQIQSQGVSAASLQMPVPMPLQMGNAAQVQQPVFVQGLQHHPMQPPGMMHQGQGLGFATQMGPQLPHQLGNIGIGMAPQFAQQQGRKGLGFATQMGPQLPHQLGSIGIGMAPQFPQQQGGKFGIAQRKTTVKSTDPKTHEKLRLDKRTDTFADGGSSSLRSHANMPPQSQPFASHPMNYYANSYGATNLFFPAGSSVPLPSGQIAPNPRFIYPVSQGVQNASLMNSSTNSPLPGSKIGSAMCNVSEPQISEHVRDVNTSVLSASSGTVQFTVKPATSTPADKNLDQPSSNVTPAQSGNVQVRPPESASEKVVDLPSTASRFSVVDKVVSNKSLRPSGDSNSSDYHKDSVTSETSVWQPKQGSESKSLSAGESRREPLSRSNSMKDNQKKTSKRGQAQAQSQPQTHSHMQIGGQSDGSADPDGVETKRNTPTGTIDDSLKEPSIVSVSNFSPLSSDGGEAKVGNDVDGSAIISPENTGTGESVDTVDAVPKEHHGMPKVEEHKESEVTESSKENNDSSKISSASTAFEPLDLTKKNEEGSTPTNTASGNEVSTPETTELPDKPVISHIEGENSNTIDVPKDIKKPNGDSSSTLEGTLNRGSADDEDTKTGGKQFASVSTQDNDASAKHDGEAVENAGGTSTTLTAPSSKHVELARSKSKKKRREILQKAVAQGTISDLYMAYKGPEEKKEIVSSVVAESNSTASSNLKQASDFEGEPLASKKGAESDDWEDAADVSTPKLEASDSGKRAHGDSSEVGKDGNSNAANKYSRDFLLKFSDQFTDLPENFLNVPDIAEALMSINVSHLVDRDSYPSSKNVELVRSKSKKKRRQILQRADARGTTSDLCMAYKGPEEKKEIVSSAVAESNSTASSNLKQAPDFEVEPLASKKGVTYKTEPDDWEDAADVSTPKLEASDSGERAHGDSSEVGKDGNSNAAKKYSRDFLLMFSDQFTHHPENFLNTPDIASADYFTEQIRNSRREVTRTVEITRDNQQLRLLVTTLQNRLSQQLDDTQQLGLLVTTLQSRLSQHLDDTQRNIRAMEERYEQNQRAMEERYKQNQRAMEERYAALQRQMKLFFAQPSHQPPLPQQ